MHFIINWFYKSTFILIRQIPLETFSFSQFLVVIYCNITISATNIYN